jgi:DNA polymerase-3 subunit epsilon/CBS domain-containing protein
VTRSNPKDLLYVDIFFDLAAARGNAELADTLWRNAYDLGSRGADFAKLLAEAGPGHEPPISLIGGFRTREGRVDLKMGGLLPIVSTARLLSIRHHVLARSTPARLEGLRQLEIGPSADLEGLVEIHRLIVDHILRQQIDDIAAGVPPSNKIEVRRLMHARRKELRDALKALKTIKPMTRDLIFAERLGG